MTTLRRTSPEPSRLSPGKRRFTLTVDRGPVFTRGLEGFLRLQWCKQLAVRVALFLSYCRGSVRAGDTVSSSTLVILREGTRERPLFIAHSMSGTLLELWTLVREMDCNCAVYGIQGRGLREGEVPNSRVEDMASDYVEQIRSVQPHGRYALRVFYGWTDRV